jgi:hypothetical protein
MWPGKSGWNFPRAAFGTHDLETAKGDPLKTYILRLYRFEKDRPRGLVGVLEEVGKRGKMAFTNYDELWEILNSPKGISPGKKKATKESGGKGGDREAETCRGHVKGDC